MAHQLELINGAAQMFSVKKTPWHGLGVILEEPPTSEEAIVAAGLNWTVSKRQTFYVTEGAQGSLQSLAEVPNRFAIIRDSDNKCLGHSGKDWKPLQNKDAFKFFDPFVQAGEATYETAGSLFGGERIWVMAKIARKPIEVVKGDYVEKFIILSNTHSGGVAVTGGLTPIRVVCNNTLSGAMMDKRSRLFRATHSSQMEKRLEDIQADIASADQAFERAADSYRQFAKKFVTKQSFDQFMSQVYQWSIGDVKMSPREEAFKNKQTLAIQQLFEEGQGAQMKGVRGTVWGLFNAVTEHTAHVRGKDSEKRLDQNWFGAGAEINKRAFDAALALVG